MSEHDDTPVVLCIKGVKMNCWVDTLDPENACLEEAQLMDGTVVTETVTPDEFIAALIEYHEDWYDGP
jgi:hypothetical protein